MGAAKRYLLDSIDRRDDAAADDRGDRESGRDAPPRLTPNVLETHSMSRHRERILANLDEMYREAFERAKATGDDSQMASLDFAYRREQLYFEILLDIRDGLERR